MLKTYLEGLEMSIGVLGFLTPLIIILIIVVICGFISGWNNPS